MRGARLVIAATLFLLANNASAQGTKDYTGPRAPTNVSPLTTGTTPPTPNWRANAYPYGYRVVPSQRRTYPVQGVR
jgi:hypothetical protein